jgi:hypothetical protein
MAPILIRESGVHQRRRAVWLAFRHVGRRTTARAGFFNAQRKVRSLRGIRAWMVFKANWVVRFT